ncbi:hypothetical protein PLESTM_001353600 [Pleodorina starrii]|nr:hypothetical protein PLESTM_001353600 [Pleodorina starrii]
MAQQPTFGRQRTARRQHPGIHTLSRPLPTTSWARGAAALMVVLLAAWPSAAAGAALAAAGRREASGGAARELLQVVPVPSLPAYSQGGPRVPTAAQALPPHLLDAPFSPPLAASQPSLPPPAFLVAWPPPPPPPPAVRPPPRLRLPPPPEVTYPLDESAAPPAYYINPVENDSPPPPSTAPEAASFDVHADSASAAITLPAEPATTAATARLVLLSTGGHADPDHQRSSRVGPAATAAAPTSSEPSFSSFTREAVTADAVTAGNTGHAWCAATADAEPSIATGVTATSTATPRCASAAIT